MSDYRLKEFLDSMVEITKDEFQDFIRGMRQYSMRFTENNSIVVSYSNDVRPRAALEICDDGRMYFYREKPCEHRAYDIDNMVEFQRKANETILKMNNLEFKSTPPMTPEESYFFVDQAELDRYAAGVVVIDSEGKYVKLITPWKYSIEEKLLVSSGHDISGFLRSVVIHNPTTGYWAEIPGEISQDVYSQIIDKAVDERYKVGSHHDRNLNNQIHAKPSRAGWLTRLRKNPTYYIVTRTLLAAYMAMAIPLSPNLWWVAMFIFGVILATLSLVLEIRDIILKENQ